MTCGFIILELNGPGPNGQCPNNCVAFNGQRYNYHCHAWQTGKDDCHVLWVHPVTQDEGREAKTAALADCPLRVEIDARHVSVCSGNNKLVSWTDTAQWDFLAILGHHMFYATNRDNLLQKVKIIAAGNCVYERLACRLPSRNLKWENNTFVLQSDAPVKIIPPPLLLAGLDNVARSLGLAFNGDNTNLTNELITVIKGRLR